MSRIAGRNARCYVAVTSGGSAEPIPFISAFTISRKTDRYDGTAFGDTNKVKVAGLPDASGSASGFYDSATAQLFTAATDGVARPTYFYEDITQAGAHYDYGLCLWDADLNVPVEGIVGFNATWDAAGPLTRVG